MGHTAFFWLFCNIISIMVLAFYSMMEMACVSFNKVRLQYYVFNGDKRATWINYLLQHPSRLFGTTLIGVNIALVVGSECSRQFMSALGLSPDLAALPQVIIVVIFGELAPMFAARHYAENVAMLGIPFIYLSAKLMMPFLWVVGVISKVCNLLVRGKEKEPNIYLSQEELQKILEEDQPSEKDGEEFNFITANIFSLRTKQAIDVMEPLKNIPALPSNATVAQMENLLAATTLEQIPIYHQNISNIVGIASPRDLLRATDTRRVRDYARAPWFVTENTNVMQILKQFRNNNENVAVILNHQGHAIGLMTLDDVLEEIFGKLSFSPSAQSSESAKLMIIEKTFPGDMRIAEFKKQFNIDLDPDENLTLSELLAKHLGHIPDKDESIYIEPFEFTVKETSLTEAKTILVTTHIR